MNGFIKDKEVLEEDYRVDDLLDFSSEIDRLDNLISKITYSSLVGYIGKFGSGKSTTIFQIGKRYKKSGEGDNWLEFDAWKYPERKDLWEGFVLDIAEQLGKKSEIHNKLDGTGMEPLKNTSAIASIVASLSGNLILAPILDKISTLFKGKRIERVFEIQNLLSALFSSIDDKNIFIVIEDIDRSGDAGRYFLETLRQFIKNNLRDKRIIVIVPIGEEIYNMNKELQASYHKVLDYISFFSPSGVIFKRFIKEIFNDKSFPEYFKDSSSTQQPSKWYDHLEAWCNIATSASLTMREIKSAIRLSNLNYINLKDQGYNPDPRIVLAITLLNYINTDVGGKRLITRIGHSRPINQDCPIYFLLLLIATNTSDSEEFLKKHFVEKNTIFVKGSTYTIPVFFENIKEKQAYYILSDLYLIPFGVR